MLTNKHVVAMPMVREKGNTRSNGQWRWKREREREREDLGKEERVKRKRLHDHLRHETEPEQLLGKYLFSTGFLH